MPTYVLEGGSAATLPARPLTFRVQGQRQNEVLIEARTPDGDQIAAAITPMPGVLVLPQVSGPTQIRVRPAKARTFASGTVVALAGTIESRTDPDPERAVLNGVDLSGLSHRDLVEVVPVDGVLQLTALGVVADTPLPPLAARARDIARELLGMERVPQGIVAPLEIVVDASASMRILAVDGSVGPALEVIIGVSRVTAGEEAVTVELTATHPRSVPASSPAEIPQAVHQALQSVPLATGFRSRRTGYASGWGPQAVRCVLSDGVPADLDSERVGLVVICPTSTREVLKARAPQDTAWIPVGEWGSASAYDLLTGDERPLREAVTALLGALLPPDSPLQSRLRPTLGGIDSDMTNLRTRRP